ncbi:hypothetical protein BTO20_06270 [Mycobacterium dioxanotrophicus]|uniref:Uridine kinase n=1 Tax=Mycobacterium dioxanotrophicus TaxID=482462 RepID=A0A1Y0BZD5_9MYCO|nr:hypothetical protein BTO20_06270 [Mycobacterium dioxanotrophicus]
MPPSPVDDESHGAHGSGGLTVTAPPPDEHWQVRAAADFLREVVDRAPRRDPAPVVVAIDGRSRSGKTSLATILADDDPSVAIVHTDDIAWHHSFFDWTLLLVEGILAPLNRHGAPVSYVPPVWMQRGRAGSIDVPARTHTVLVEGVGAGRCELVPWLHASIWVDTDEDLAMRRTVELDRDPQGFVADWMRAERDHLDRDQPWQRAIAFVWGAGRPSPPAAVYARFG